jgi:pyridoxamine 5'-phosphate oxidase
MKFGNIPAKEFQHKSVRQLVANFRNEYLSNGIDDKDLDSDPIVQFEKWFEEAVRNKVLEPNAMHLSTCTSDGKPSGRVMLLKGFDDSGFVFFTNYDSRKGNELKDNSYAAMTFIWLELYRQVRIEGQVSRISTEESDEYFHSRPRGSQISAVASAQSNILSDRKLLEKAVEDLEKKYKDATIPRPENWGGLRLKPESVEFWQGRVNRLHDRIHYSLDENRLWKKVRLYP